MGGRKHRLHGLPVDAAKIGKIDDPIERDMAFRSMHAAPYCIHCGKQIIDAQEDPDGANVNPEWEQHNRAHYRCHLDHQQALKAKEAAEAEKRRQAAESFDWDAYMKKMTEGR